MTQNLRTTIRAAMAGFERGGAFPPEAAGLIRAAVASIPPDTPLPSHPAEVFGPWEDLPSSAQAALRNCIEEEMRRVMASHPQGRLWPGAVGRLNGLLVRAEAMGVPTPIQALGKRIEGMAWSGPMTLGERRAVRRLEREWSGAGPVGFEHLLYALGRTPHWLLGDFARGVGVDPRCQGFHFDRDRNVTFGYLLGLDLLPADDGFWCVEANLSTAFNPARRAVLEPEPTVPVLFDVARKLGARRVEWYDPEWVDTEPWLIRELQEQATSEDMTIEISQGYRFTRSESGPPDLPAPSRFVTMPVNPPRDTVVLRRNYFPVGPDHLVGDKGPFTRGVLAQLAESGDTRVRVPAMSSDPADVFTSPAKGLPNVVYKYPGESKGLGVHFLRVDGPEEAEAIARTIDREQGKRPGLFQRFVCPRVLDGGRIYDIRCEVFITPHGAHHTFSIRREAMQSLPEDLAHGLVRQEGVFTSNLATGGRFWPVDPDEAHGAREAALAIGEALVGALNHTFETMR